jgi:hypothetical protein
MLIDMGRMKRVTVDCATQSVRVQGGALWADVNQAASQHGLAVVGGTVSQVGVGGLTLRGGYGYLTPQYGLVVDNLLAATVITSSGEELEASAYENPDLFWAVRGAGQTVGVVAELVFQAHAQPHQVWTGTRSYTGDQLPAVVRALNTALVHRQGKAAAQCVFSLSPDTGTAIIIAVLFFNGAEEEAKTHFAQLLELECISDDVTMKGYADANAMLDPVVPPGGRKKILGVQLVQLVPPVRPEFGLSLMDEISHQLSSEPDMTQSFLEIDYFDTSSICRIPVTETAFPSRNGLLNGALILQWTDPEEDRGILSWGARIQRMCDDELRQAGHKPNQLVSNFAAYTRSKWQVSRNRRTSSLSRLLGDRVIPADMFGVNASRLLEVKAKYDPENVFNKLNPLDAQGR